MKCIYSTIGALLFAYLSVTAAPVEFPGTKDEQKVVSVMADGKIVAELKILVPVTIEATGADISVVSQPGSKHTMKIKDGSIEIQPEKGKAVKTSGEIIYIYGYGKRAEKK